MKSNNSTVTVPEALQPARTFDAASSEVVDYLSAVVPMGLWAVTRVVGDRQIILYAKDRAYGFGAGAERPFSGSPCWAMASGAAPQIAPDVAAVAAYSGLVENTKVPMGAYIGAPIVEADGHLFGTVCGFNPQPLSETLMEQQPLLGLLSNLLSSVLGADQAATAAQRQVEESQREADTDALTGLLNRRGWDRYIAREEERFRRFGDQASVVVLDLDRLKTINDIQGHEAGDQHIRHSARVLSTAVRAGDILARLGGDEFGLVIAGLSVDLVAQRVLRMEDSLESAGIAGSFGHAPITVLAGFPGAWKAADAAMYEAKRRRKAVAGADGGGCQASRTG